MDYFELAANNARAAAKSAIQAKYDQGKPLTPALISEIGVSLREKADQLAALLEDNTDPAIVTEIDTISYAMDMFDSDLRDRLKKLEGTIND